MRVPRLFVVALACSATVSLILTVFLAGLAFGAWKGAPAAAPPSPAAGACGTSPAPLCSPPSL
jgi:hypothetical protein